MSRIIKFRAWHEGRKEWLHDGKPDGCHILGETIWAFGEWCRVPLEELNDVVVEQFTGLKDAKGQDIYEGDLCRHEIGWTAMATATTWLNEDGSPSHAFTYAFTVPGTPYREDFRFVHEAQLKVVGNIHQDAHLLISDAPLS